ncbi:MAG: radical SAM protein [Alphaproteobacteria bacterium]|nr:MAG: radical SAM protein [Alphaproteobacteria bacterium]
MPDHRGTIAKPSPTQPRQSSPRSISPSPQFVVKVTKYCNLRCDYCYEFPHLGDKSRMRLEQLRLLFENIKRSIAELAVEDINFIWHGGEPLLVPLEFYEQLALIEKDVFGSQFSCKNTIQTNLTVLTARHIKFLREGFFDDIGVSFDVYGDQRIDTSGKSRTDAVRANMQTLLDNQIEFAAIAVLTKVGILQVGRPRPGAASWIGLRRARRRL